MRTLRDPVAFEVTRNALTSIADEMGLVMLRASHSIAARDARDFSTALCDPEGGVLAQGNTILVHLGAVSAAVREAVARFEGRIHPGDVFIVNETAEFAQHLPDVCVIRPCFAEDTLIGFSVCVCHHVDMGGSVLGSCSPDSTEVFAEGLQIPLVKLVEAGHVNETFKALLLQNVRLPDLVWGDIEGQLAACYVGESEFVELAGRHGPEELRTFTSELYDYTEQLTRLEIADMPDGDYSFEDGLDDDGVTGGPVRLYVTIRIRGDSLEVDWTGSAAQLRSALNCPLTNTRSITYGALEGAFHQEIISNEGFYRPITITAPPGTVVNPVRPAAHAARGVTLARMLDVLFGALIQAVPQRIPAAPSGGPHRIQIAGAHRDGKIFSTFLSPHLEAWGGRDGLDGVDGVSPFQANISAWAVEDLEREHGIRVMRREFLPDSGGPGRWRGGLGYTSEARFLGATGSIILRYGRRLRSPFGVLGGRPGTRTRVLLNPGTPEERELPSNGILELKTGDVLRMHTPGGGGYGDPRLRDTAAIEGDIAHGKVTIEHAQREYGVVVDPASGAVSRRGGE